MTTDKTYTGLVSVLQEALGEFKKQLYTSMPGNIVSFDSNTFRATVQPAIRLMLEDGQELHQPLLTDVPMVTSRSGSYTLWLPPQPGDPVWLMFSQRSIEEFKRTLIESSPRDSGVMEITDVVFLPGFHDSSEFTPPSGVPADSLVLQHNSGSPYIAISSGRIDIGGALYLNGSAVTP